MLDNPIWHSLASRHSAIALSHGKAKRYPPDVTPFVAVSEPSEDAEADLRELVLAEERVGILSIIPPMEEGWSLVKEIEIYQYELPVGSPAVGDPEAVKLGAEHIPAMLQLTALVYPAYFREGTARLGDYYGFFRDGQLCAMAGIRMSMGGFQELSAICTHPDHRGKGYATRLTGHLISRVQSQGDVAFLHTESDNQTAQALYEKLGFFVRKVLPFRIFERS